MRLPSALVLAAAEAGVDDVLAEATPEDKLALIAALPADDVVERVAAWREHEGRHMAELRAATPPEPGSIAVQAFVNRGAEQFRAMSKGLAAMVIAAAWQLAAQAPSGELKENVLGLGSA